MSYTSGNSKIIGLSGILTQITAFKPAAEEKVWFTTLETILKTLRGIPLSAHRRQLEKNVYRAFNEYLRNIKDEEHL